MKSLFLAAASRLAAFVPVNYGPGPTVLRSGNTDLGFFGEMTTAELVTGPSLATLVGIVGGTMQATGNAWLKCIDQGKVLYIAKTPMMSNTNWSMLNNAGAVLGKTVTILGRKFKVRLLTGATADPGSVAGGEWNRLLYPLCRQRPAGVVALADYTETQLRMLTTSAGSASWCKELYQPSGYYTIRGYAGVQHYGGGNNIGSNASLFGWRPVLELVG